MMPSLLPIDEPVVRRQGTVRAWQGIARMPETSGVNVAAILAHINARAHAWTHSHILAVPQQSLLSEDELRWLQRCMFCSWHLQRRSKGERARARVREAATHDYTVHVRRPTG